MLRWPSNTTSIINKIRELIGRVVTVFVTVSGIPCTLCTLNPVTGLSTNPFCSGCGGYFWRDTTSGWDTLAHITWRRSEQPLWVAGGIIDEGDCIATIASSGIALYNVTHAHHFLVDGKEMYMKNYRLRGVQEVNRITITLLEDKG